MPQASDQGTGTCENNGPGIRDGEGCGSKFRNASGITELTNGEQ